MQTTPRASQQHNDSMSSTAQAEESLKELILKVLVLPNTVHRSIRALRA
jgi:hypothetical protein